MKAISLKEPWLQLIIDGHKTVEFRTWQPKKYNMIGEDLLLCSSKSKVKFAYHQFSNLYSTVGQFEAEDNMNSHLGMARAVVRIKNIVPLHYKHRHEPGFLYHEDSKRTTYAWELENVRVLTEPFPVKGRLGIYDVDMPGQKDGSTIYVDFKL